MQEFNGVRPFWRELARCKLLKHFSWLELNIFLQIVWNGPVRQKELFGLEKYGERWIKRALKKLRERKLVMHYDEGYKAIVIPESKLNTFLWLTPLLFKHLSLEARTFLIFLDEQVDGMGHSNHKQVATRMGISRQQFYKLLRECKDRMVVWTAGRKNQRVTTLRKMKTAHDTILVDIITNPSKNFHCKVAVQVAPQERPSGLRGTRKVVSEEHTGFPSGLPFRVTHQKRRVGDSSAIAEVSTRIITTSLKIQAALNQGSPNPLLSPKAIQKELKKHEDKIQALHPASFIVFLKLVGKETRVNTVKLFVETRTIEQSLQQAFTYPFKNYVKEDEKSYEWTRFFKECLAEVKDLDPNIWNDARSFVNITYGVPLSK